MNISGKKIAVRQHITDKRGLQLATLPLKQILNNMTTFSWTLVIVFKSSKLTNQRIKLLHNNTFNSLPHRHRYKVTTERKAIFYFWVKIQDNFRQQIKARIPKVMLNRGALQGLRLAATSRAGVGALRAVQGWFAQPLLVLYKWHSGLLHTLPFLFSARTYAVTQDIRQIGDYPDLPDLSAQVG